MLKAILLASVALFVPQIAYAFGKAGDQLSTQCKTIWLQNDGCLGAMAGASFINPDFFTNARQSVGNASAYQATPDWDVAGVAFAVGHNPATATRDPSIYDWTGTGCTYYASAHLSMQSAGVYCASGTNLTIENFDFSLHGGLNLYVTNAYTGKIVINNNNFVNGASSNVAGNSLIKSSTTSNFDLTLTNNTFDGGSLSGYNILQYFMTDLSVGASAGAFCTKTIQYNVFKNIGGDPMSVKNSFCKTTVAFNYFTNWITNPVGTGLHGAVMSQTPDANTSVLLEAYRYNTALTPNTVVLNSGTTTFSFLGNPANNTSVTTAVADHNVVVVNTVGGAVGSPSTVAASSALFSALALASITDLTVTNNYVDPTGAYYCMSMTGATGAVAATIDNGSGGAGALLTAYNGGSNLGGIYPGAFFGVSSSDVNGGYIASYNTVSNDTGLATTGTGAAGTYVLYTTQNGPTQGPASNSSRYTATGVSSATSSITVASLPGGVATGWTVYDVTTPGAFKAGLAISTIVSNTVNFAVAIGGTGVVPGDTILFTPNYSTFTVPVLNTTNISGNVNMRDNSTITASGKQLNAGQCNGHI